MYFYQKELFFDFERPVVASFNPNFFLNLNASSLRYGQRDPVHYLNLHFTNKVPLDKNMLVSNIINYNKKNVIVSLRYVICISTLMSLH